MFEFPDKPEIMITCFVNEKVFKTYLGIKKRIIKSEDWFVVHKTPEYEMAYDYEEGIKILISKPTAKNVKATVDMIKNALKAAGFKDSNLPQRDKYGSYYLVSGGSTLLGGDTKADNDEIGKLLEKNGFKPDKDSLGYNLITLD